MIIKQIIPSGFCLECCGCCRYTQKDTIWSALLLESEQKALSLQDKKVPLIPNPGEDNFICSFLDPQTIQCRIYNQRPFDCWLYPFLLNIQHDSVFLAVDLNCLYVERFSETIEFKNYTEYLIELLNSQEFLEIIKDNKNILQAYDSVKNLAKLNIPL